MFLKALQYGPPTNPLKFYRTCIYFHSPWALLQTCFDLKGTVSKKLRWVLLYINQNINPRPLIAHHKILTLVKIGNLQQTITAFSCTAICCCPANIPYSENWHPPRIIPRCVCVKQYYITYVLVAIPANIISRDSYCHVIYNIM